MAVNSHETAIELAKQKIDLMDYIEHATGVKAKRRSKSYVFDPCPFCGKKNHFFVVPEKNFYHTFSGCGKSGTIIDFLMEYEKLTLQEAIKKNTGSCGDRTVSWRSCQAKPPNAPGKRRNEKPDPTI